MMSKGYAAGGVAKKKKGYASGGAVKDSVGRALGRKTEDAEGRAMKKKPVKMQMGGMTDPRMGMDPRMAPRMGMKKGGMAKKKGG